MLYNTRIYIFRRFKCHYSLPHINKGDRSCFEIFTRNFVTVLKIWQIVRFGMRGHNIVKRAAHSKRAIARASNKELASCV